MMENKEKQLTKDEHTALQRYIRGKDRGRARIFVGRKSEMEAVQERLDWLMQRQAEGESEPGADLTTVIQGAPGAGKSALLGKIEEQWSLGVKGQPVAIRLGAGSLKLPMGKLLANIAKEAGGHPGIRRTLARFSSISLTVAGLANVTFNTDAASLSSQTLTPIILLFDEIQSVLLGEISAQSREHLRENLGLLHTGEHNAPVFPVYGGLANSADLLRSAGLTRLASGSEWTLSGFSDDEIDELMHRFVNEYLSSVELNSVTLDRWQEALRRDSQGWPMHTRNFLIALCEEIQVQDWRPAAVDLDTVRLRAQQLRYRYYAQRLRNELEEQESLVSTVLEALRQEGPMLRRQLVNHIAKAMHDGLAREPDSRTVLRRMTAKGTFDAMLHAGIVQKVDEYAYACPIPSLGSQLAAMATLPSNRLHHAVLQGQLDAIVQVLERCRNDEQRSTLLQSTDPRGRTPLIVATELGLMPLVESLVAVESQVPKALRSVGLRDHDGWTARDHAAASGDARLVVLVNQLMD